MFIPFEFPLCMAREHKSKSWAESDSIATEEVWLERLGSALAVAGFCFCSAACADSVAELSPPVDLDSACLEDLKTAAGLTETFKTFSHFAV